MGTVLCSRLAMQPSPVHIFVQRSSCVVTTTKSHKPNIRLICLRRAKYTEGENGLNRHRRVSITTEWKLLDGVECVYVYAERINFRQKGYCNNGNQTHLGINGGEMRRIECTNIACRSRYWIQFFPIIHYDIRHILLYYCFYSMPLIFRMIYGGPE